MAAALALLALVGAAVGDDVREGASDAGVEEAVRETLARGAEDGTATVIRRLEALAKEHPGAQAPLVALMRVAERSADFEVAERALDRLVAQEPDRPEWRQQRGVVRFFQADIAGSLEDFDAYLEAHPERIPYHWQRGLSLYYAGRFREGVAQFERHRAVNPDDVENAVWHFLCKARVESVEAARDALFPYTRDPRVPMKEIHDLFAGRGSREAVLAAARSGESAADGNTEDAEIRNQLCYAHLYLALHEEILGRPESSLEDARRAARDYAMPHYMGRVAQVHLRLREAGDGAGEAPDEESGRARPGPEGAVDDAR